jgi:predicted AAA+ superfamily ATPase
MRTFPAVVVTGPRQSGKTTLLRAVGAGTHRFVSLEDPDIRMRAQEDPRGFLDRYPPPVIIDEIQYFPDLLSYIKTRIDERRAPGHWLFSGSQNFVLMQGVSQSLAGRAAVLSLLPFSMAERLGRGDRTPGVHDWLRGLDSEPPEGLKADLADVILRGGYPEIASRKAVDRQIWCGSYVSTYLERDVRNLAHIGDLSQFERFLKLCAVRTGQILNLSDLARETGVSVPTAKRWLSVLETGYQVFLLTPYYANIGKRLIKSPKLYFTDTALASYLLGLHDWETLFKSPHFGALFETLVVTDVWKRHLQTGEKPSLYFFRTRDGLETDLVVEDGNKLRLFELKSGMTIVPKHAASLVRLRADLGPIAANAYILSAARGRFPLGRGITNLNWLDALGV